MKAIRLLVLGAVVLITAYASTASAYKGLPWDIRQTDSPTVGVTVFLNFEFDDGEPAAVSVAVTYGMSPEDKTAAIVAAIANQEGAKLAAWVSEDPTKAKVAVAGAHPTANEIKSVEYLDGGSGEGLHIMKDDPGLLWRPITKVTLLVWETGTAANGKFTLGVELPGGGSEDAVVDTLGETGATIMGQLVTAFNKKTSVHGYTASINQGILEIPGVPCPRGIRFGTNDTGLNYRLKRTVYDWQWVRVPTISEWGLIIFALVLLATGAIVVARRQSSSPAR